MDLYELLGLGRGATLIEIKRSYKRLARKYHPDINPGDHTAEVRFKEITRAYETLSDPERRLRYDAGALSSASNAVSFEFEGFDFSAATSHIDTTFGDLFAEISDAATGQPADPVRTRRRSSCERDAELRRGDAGGPASAHADAPRDVPCMPRRGRVEDCRRAMPSLSGDWHYPLPSREHGVFEELRGVRRRGTSRADQLRHLFGAGR